MYFNTRNLVRELSRALAAKLGGPGRALLPSPLSCRGNRRLQSALAAGTWIDPGVPGLQMSTSIGVASFPESSHDADGVLRQSVYVLASQRGRGHLSRYVAATDLPFVTGPHCELEAFFTRRGVAFGVTADNQGIPDALLPRLWRDIPG